MTTDRTLESRNPAHGILARVQHLLRERFDLQEAQVAADRPLADLGIDSLASIEFMFDLEEEFGVLFTDERSPIATVRDVALLVEREVALKAARAA